jgi:hypothetical protein
VLTVGGGDGGRAGDVANGDRGDVAAGLDTGTTVARGADDVVGVEAVGPVICEGAVDAGPAAPWAFGRAGPPRLRRRR